VPNHPVAIVTGASRGIGRGIARELARIDFSVVVNFASNQAAADETKADLDGLGAGKIVLCQADLADTADRGRLVDTTLETFGRIDLLVNNAGVAPRERADILVATEQSYDRVMATNLKGPYFLTQRVANEMIRLVGEGTVTAPKIVNISSISAFTSSPSRGEYCLSKAGISMMTKLYADRLAGHGIAVFEIQPGVIATDMTAAVKDKYDKLIAEGLTPIPRWGTPADIGTAVAAIARGSLPFTTGQVLNLDGGFHLHRL